MSKTTREEIKAWLVMAALLLASCIDQLEF